MSYNQTQCAPDTKVNAYVVCRLAGVIRLIRLASVMCDSKQYCMTAVYLEPV